MNTATQPIYPRCVSGLRAGVFSLLILAEQESWTEAQYLEQFKTLGIEQKRNHP